MISLSKFNRMEQLRTVVCQELELESGTVLDFGDLEQLADIARKLVKKGNSFVAYKLTSLVDEKLIRENPSLCFAHCFAMTREGKVDQAQRMLLGLIEDQPKKLSETTSVALVRDIYALLAKTFKSQGMPNEPGGEIRDKSKIESAIDFYKEAENIIPDGFGEINLAFLKLLIGQVEESRTHAARAIDICQTSEQQSYWKTAIMAESTVLLGNDKRAKELYQEFRKDVLHNEQFGDFFSVYWHAEFLLGALGRSPDEAKKFLLPPTVAVFSGHRIDIINESNQSVRFPESIADDVKEKIAKWLDENDVEFGFSSAACGSDILFIEALKERNAKPFVILPASPELFKQFCVTKTDSGRWQRAFDKIMESCPCEIATDFQGDFGELAFQFTNLLMHGSAILFADRFGFQVKRLAVWDGKVGRGPSGTFSVIKQWKDLSDDIQVIKIEDGKAHAATILKENVREIKNNFSSDIQRADLQPALAYLLFADVRGFSELSESQIPLFVKNVLGAIAALFPNYPSILKRNTWGDGIFVAFSSIHEAGNFALALADLFINQKWREPDKLPKLAIRTALHAGPVFICDDPVTETTNCIGTHVSHAARLEPSTSENQVFVSNEFAAIWAAEGITDFVCEYQGPLNWAKSYGTFPTYILKKP